MVYNLYRAVVHTILKSDQWRQALKFCTNSDTKEAETPLRKLIKTMPGTFKRCLICATYNDIISKTLAGAAELVFENSVEKSKDGNSISYNFEFLEDYQDLRSVTCSEQNGRMESEQILLCTTMELDIKAKTLDTCID